VRELIEAAFVQLQSPAAPDPFIFTIDYFGYDYFQSNTGYLGYFIVSIGLKGGQTYASSAASYWDLLVNNTPSALGMDSRLVAAGDQVRLEWVHASATRCGQGHRRKDTKPESAPSIDNTLYARSFGTR
jgi:hypothetical protein